MARLIQEKIKKPLAEELLFGKLVHGGHFIVGLAGDDIDIEILERETATEP
jgi:ATP-dependent Clp protease ATP-binding subunit ClpA